MEAATPTIDLGPQRRAVVYLRVGRAVEADTTTDDLLERQRAACERTAEALGLTVADEYADVSTSGRASLNSALQALLARVTTEQDVQYVIVESFDRLTRNPIDAMDIRTTLDGARVSLVVAQEERKRAAVKRAVIYLRVSTKKQVKKDLDPDGLSLPAQREMCERKAEQLGAEVVEVYIDRGESAKTADRPQFREMLARIKRDRDVDFVILDKVDRFARNRRDDANVLFELRMAGAELVSVKENIDETPAGGLVHGIMATIAEYESRNNAVRATQGMAQKAKVGGTPNRAPVGYLNRVERLDGREVRTVVVDPERAPLVQWAFEAYATGEWTITSLHEALVERGLRCLPNGRGEPGPIHRSHVANFLANRYYVGYVSWKGTEYEGRHAPLVSRHLFDQVQAVLRSRHRAGERQRVHRHYLKGTLFCGRCGARMCFMEAKGNGGTYPYFFCLGRHQGTTGCRQPYVPADEIERLIELEYQRRVQLPQAVQDAIRDGLRAELDRQRTLAAPEAEQQERRSLP